MARLSNIELRQETLTRINDRFTAEVAAIKSTKDASAFLNELLGKEEKLVIAKRLVAIAMISEGITSYRIAQALGMSHSTVDRLRTRYKLGHFEHVLEHCRKKLKRAQFWSDVEVLIRLGMPPQGRGRWKFIEASQALERRK